MSARPPIPIHNPQGKQPGLHTHPLLERLAALPTAGLDLCTRNVRESLLDGGQAQIQPLVPIEQVESGIPRASALRGQLPGHHLERDAARTLVNVGPTFALSREPVDDGAERVGDGVGCVDSVVEP